MQANCPRHVVFENRGFNQAGSGRAPGSVAYVSPATGQVLEVYFAEVVQTGSLFGLARVANNAALPLVRVDQGLLNGSGPMRLGAVLLIGPLEYLPNGPRAKAVWPVSVQQTAPPIRPANIERLGVISAVKAGGFGFIRSDGGADVFWHVTELHGFTPFVGMRVAYTPISDDRGVKARNVRPA